MRPKAKQFNKKRNLNSAKQNIYMYATKGVWADGGAELEPLTSACGFFFSLSNSTRRPFDTWDNWHDLPYVCVKKQRVTLFFFLPPSCWIVTFLPPPEYIILSRVIDTQDFFFEVERERETREFDTDELSHVGRNLSLSGCLAFCDVVLWFILHHSYRVLCVYPESSTQRWSSSCFLLFA